MKNPLDDTLRRGRAAVGSLGRPRTGAKRTLMSTVRQIPNYLKLLFGLMTDRRVAALDKALVGLAIAYILAPIDLIPDVIPFLGEVDDIFLLSTALQRLMSNAGRRVLLDHWSGAAADLSEDGLQQVVAAATFFLPLGIRRRLTGMVKSAGAKAAAGAVLGRVRRGVR